MDSLVYHQNKSALIQFTDGPWLNVLNNEMRDQTGALKQEKEMAMDRGGQSCAYVNEFNHPNLLACQITDKRV